MEYGELLVHRVDAAWATDHEEDGKRTHLGASIIGQNCLRAVWYSFRWADHEQFEGRMLRLFNRGHNQEGIFVALLRGVGAKVFTHDAAGKQFRVSTLGGHAGGSIDGVATYLPDLPYGLPAHTPVLLEMKTHKEKYFNQLKSKGLIASFPKHYRQAQFYMHLMSLQWCLYCAVNKNDDSLWFYLFPYDKQVAFWLTNRAETIVYGSGIPARISENRSWHECRICSMRHVCFKDKQADRNCRTCKYSHADRDGNWYCMAGQPEIKTKPKTGCTLHDYHPDLC